MIISVCFMRRIGIPHCPKCGKEIKKQTVDQMVDQIMELAGADKDPAACSGRARKKRNACKVTGAGKEAADMSVCELTGICMNCPKRSQLDKNIKHNIEIVVDRLIVKPGIEKRLTDSIENVLESGGGAADCGYHWTEEPMNFSQSFSCPDCGISIDEIEPRSFSFNNPFGACPDCFGLGYKMEFDEDLMIPDQSLSISRGSDCGAGMAVLYG